MKLFGEVRGVYARIGRTYFSWSPTLMALAVLVFVPIGLIDALSTTRQFQELDIDTWIGIATVVGVIGALTATSLIGEVFYSGAIAISLTHPADEEPPTLRQLARRIDYKRLIAVDIVYVVLVVVGLLLFIVPGVLAFIWLGLAGPVIELEKRGVKGALKRSYDLVRGHFWLCFWVFVPLELLGDTAGEAIGHWVHGLFGNDFIGTWLGEATASIILSPLVGIAAVLLTVDLIRASDGTGPIFKHSPSEGRSTVSA